LVEAEDERRRAVDDQLERCASALFAARVTLTTPIVAAAFIVALIPPAQSMIRTLRRSEQRNLLLSELAKYQEHVREGASAGSGDSGKG